MHRLLGGLVLFGAVCGGATDAAALGANYRGPFEGRAVDAETGEPIEGAVVFIRWDISNLGSDMFFDTAEVLTDAHGWFYIPANWSWNPFRTMRLYSRGIILKAGYRYLDLPHWGAVVDAKAIVERVRISKRGTECEWVPGGEPTVMALLECTGDASPYRLRDGQAVFSLTKKQTRGTQLTSNLDTTIHDVPEHKIRRFREELEHDSALPLGAPSNEPPTISIGVGGGLLKVPPPGR